MLFTISVIAAVSASGATAFALIIFGMTAPVATPAQIESELDLIEHQKNMRKARR